MTRHRNLPELVVALLASLVLSLSAARAQAPAAPADATPAERRLAAEKLIALAEVQAQLDELDAAEQSYFEAIELIESVAGEFAAPLIDAYRGLADVLSRRGDYAEAVTVLEQARHISRRNLGLFNLEQAELLDELSEVYEAAGDTGEAQAMQREMLDVAIRHFGGEKPGVIPYHYRLAEYYELARMHGLARDEYEQALEILADDPQSRAADALRPLRELVRIDTVLGERTGAAQRLREALEASVDAAPLERAEALAVLGDAALAAGDDEAALRRYREAGAALGPTAADEFFGRPHMIDFVPPPGPVDWGRRSDRDYAWGSITARFALSPRGRAQGIEIVAADPPGLMDARYAERLAEAVFRPRLVGGQPVATPRVRYSHVFRYFLPESD